MCLIPAKSKQDNDAVEEGLRTTVQPAAKAGNTFHTPINNGKFQGVMPVTMVVYCEGVL